MSQGGQQDGFKLFEMTGGVPQLRRDWGRAWSAGGLSRSIAGESLTVTHTPKKNSEDEASENPWVTAGLKVGQRTSISSRNMHSGSTQNSEPWGTCSGFWSVSLANKHSWRLWGSVPWSRDGRWGRGLDLPPLLCPLMYLSHLWQHGYSLHFWSKAIHFLLLYTIVPSGHPTALRAAKWLTLYNNRRISYGTLNTQMTKGINCFLNGQMSV